MALVETMYASESIDGNSYSMFSSARAFEEMVGIAGLYLALGAPIAYAIVLLIGLPIYLVFKHKGLINFWSVTIGGALVAIAPLLIMTANRGFILYTDPEKSSIAFYLAIAACGYAVSLVFWVIAKAGSENGT